MNAKMESGKVTGANVSVKIDDDFMRSALENIPYVQQYPVRSDNPWFKEVDANVIWEKNCTQCMAVG